MSAADEQQIRSLIETWAKAVHEGDMETVLRDHTDDILMFDVPPPFVGVRGIDEYRETWPPFFRFQEAAAFDLSDLQVTVGGDVAFATALVVCATPEMIAEQPDGFRMRLTVGLRKEDGRWQVAHEHHSFPDLSTPS